MDKILIVGIDSVVGANVAAWWAGRSQITGLSHTSPIVIAGCETNTLGNEQVSAARDWVASTRPDAVVYCGTPSISCWLPQASAFRNDSILAAAAWAKSAAEFGAGFTCISSDAVFTGPWMFHRETSTAVCDSSSAKMLRMIERSVVEANPASLIVRTHAFGFAPIAAVPSFVDLVCQALERESTLDLDYMRHATPILATDLAELLWPAIEQRLSGVLNLGGGERINPFRMAYLIGDYLGLSSETLRASEPSADDRRSFGAGETSLQTRRARKTLQMGIPLIREGLARLAEQRATGYLDRFSVPNQRPERVA